MKNKVVVLVLAAAMALQLGACGATKEETAPASSSVSEAVEETSEISEAAEEVEEPEEVLDVIGTEAEGAQSVKIINELGQNIKELTVKVTGDKFGDNMMSEGQTVADKAAAMLYFTPEKKEETETQEDGPAINETYMMKVVLEDGTKLTFSVFPMNDMDECVLKVEDKVPYIEYTSIESGDKVDTKDAEKAYKEEQAKKKAEKKAKEEAEKKAKEEAEKKAKEEAEAAAAAQAQAEAEVAAQAQAQAEAEAAAAAQAQAEAEAAAAAAQAAAQAQQQAAQQQPQEPIREGCLDF